MMNDFDFIHLYEELNSINEETVLTEADQERGVFKKAFANLLHGVYYISKEHTGHKDENGKWQSDYEVKDNEVQLRSKAVISNPKNIVSNRTGKQGTLGDITARTGIQTKQIDLDNPENDTTISREKEIQKNNDVLDNSDQRAIYLHKDKETGENVYGIFNIRPSVLHHIDGNHDHNVDKKQLISVKVNGKSTTLLRADAQGRTDPTIGNYVLITADTKEVATLAHRLIHLLAMITNAIGNGETARLAEVFEEILKDKNGESRVLFQYIDENYQPQETSSFIDFTTNAKTCLHGIPTNLILTEHEKILHPQLVKATADEIAEDATTTANDNNDKEEE